MKYEQKFVYSFQMAHNIKIDDKTYDKLKAYCDLNSLSVHTVTKEAIEFYLNDIMYGDAPFLKPNTVDSKGNVYTEEVVEKLKEEANSKYHDENGKLIMTAVSAEDGEKQLVEFLSTHTYDEFVKKEEPKEEEVKPKRPTKRRL